MSPPPKLTRRGMTIGGVAALGAAIVAGGILEVPRLFKRRARGRYAEIVNQLDNPESAALIGKSVEIAVPDGITMAEESARDLKVRLARQSLATVMKDDISSGSVVEADGWVIPLALAEICLLASESV